MLQIFDIIDIEGREIEPRTSGAWINDINH